MSSLKKQTLSGMSWSFAGTVADRLIGFVVGIILARLLTPKEYGLVGIVAVFIVLTEPFIDSGFSNALIRKKDCTKTDYSTVFYFNFLIGILVYLALFFSAPVISTFFKEPQLTGITRAVGLVVLIDAAALIQTTILTKQINFRKQTVITVTSTVISGSLGIYLAYNGYGVWSLVYRTIAQHATSAVLLWVTSNWRPAVLFSNSSFREMFRFGSSILISAIIDKLYFNIYNLIIAKFFSARELGLYSRANMFKNIVSSTIGDIVGKISFPVLSTLQSEPERLLANYKKLLTSASFITLIILITIAASAESLVLALIGEQWTDSIIYLQLLCFAGIFYPLHAMTRTLLFVHGRSKMFLKLQVATKLLTVPAIIIGIFMGIVPLIIGMIVASVAEYIMKAYYSGKIAGYPLRKQLMDIIPGFIVALVIGGLVFLLGNNIDTKPAITLALQVLLSLMLTVALSEVFKIREYLFIKETIREKVHEIITGRFNNSRRKE